MSILEKINKGMQVGAKVLAYGLVLMILFIFVAMLYYAIIYPQKIANKTKLGMTKQQIEQVYKDNHYRYYDHLIGCSIGCTKNQLRNDLADNSATDNTDNSSVIENSVTENTAVEYMVVSTGIDAVFIVGFDKNGVVVFATSGET